MDDRARKEIHLVDAALDKLEKGGFGLCEKCGRPIAPQHLEAIPWARNCISCARDEPADQEIPSSPEDRLFQLSPDIDTVAYTDEELEGMVCEKLYQEDRLETTDLQMSCEDGIIHVTGTMPYEIQYQMLFDVLQDILPLNSIIEDIRIQSYPEDASIFTGLGAEDQVSDELLWSNQEEQS